MTNYFIVSLPRPDMEHCVKIGKFGLKLPRVISSVKEGDRVICYVTKEAMVIALGTVSKAYYQGKAKVFLSSGAFDHRFDFQAETLESPIDFRSLVDKLRLTKGSDSWGPVLRLGIARLTEDDFKLIEKLARKSDKT